MYADLLRYYGVDLEGLFASPPNVSPRKVLVLIEGLPADSATVSRTRDTPEATGWTVDSYLLASLIDAVRENTFTNIQVRTKKKLTPPERVRVPGAVVEKKPNSFVARAQQFLNQIKED